MQNGHSCVTMIRTAKTNVAVKPVITCNYNVKPMGIALSLGITWYHAVLGITV